MRFDVRSGWRPEVAARAADVAVRKPSKVWLPLCPVLCHAGETAALTLTSTATKREVLPGRSRSNRVTEEKPWFRLSCLRT